VHPHGGATRRAGTEFISEVKDSTKNVRLIPFEFNVEQAYVLEFGDEVFRIYRNGGIVVDGSDDIVEVTTPYAHTELSELKFAQSADIMFIVHPNHPPQQITRTDHDAWTVTEVDFRRGPLLDPVFDGSTLTASARTGSVTVTASENTFASTDVGRIVKVHNGYVKITAYTSATQVTATVVENQDFRDELMPSYTASTIAFFEGDPDSTGLEHNDRITDSAGGFLNAGFESGMKISVSGASNGGNNDSGLLIVSVTADTLLIAPSGDLVNESAGSSVTISGDLVADDEYQLGAFSESTGYPSCVSFFEQRLVFANTTNNPQTLFFSVAGDYTNFTQGTDDDDALTYTIGSNQVNVIRYLTSSRVLLVGTSGGEFAVRAGSVDAPISPTNTQIKRQASYGSANIQPITTGDVALFVQRAKRKMRELVYNFNTDSYVAPDMTLLAEHITEGLIKEIAFQQEPDNIVWCVLEDGKFVGMTYRREEEVIAWHEHVIGGTSSSQDYGFVESVASIPGSSDEDEVYIVVRRTIDGSEVRYVERMKPIDFGSDIEDAFFVDSGLTYSGTAATTISGLDHLEGETLSVMANGSVHPNVTVSSGSITLNRSTTKAHIGLPFSSTLQTMRIDSGGTEGTSQGKTKRVRDVTLRVYRSVGAKIGPSTSNLELIPFRDSSMAMDEAVPMYTGDKDVEFPSGYETDGFVVVVQDQPLPLTVLAIFPRLQTFDR
jgi:hypothetical protein